MNDFKNSATVHLGSNIKRIREIMGIKQYALADDCNWSQQQMSRIEGSESVDEETLEIIAKSLGVTSEFIKNFKEEKAVFNIVNNNNYDGSTPTYSDNGGGNHVHNYHYYHNALNEFFQKIAEGERQKSQTIAELSDAIKHLTKEMEKLKGEKS